MQKFLESVKNLLYTIFIHFFHTHDDILDYDKENQVLRVECLICGRKTCGIQLSEIDPKKVTR